MGAEIFRGEFLPDESRFDTSGGSGLTQTEPLVDPEKLAGVERRVDELTQDAIEDAISRLPRDHELAAETRIVNGITKRLSPYIRESMEVTLQLASPEYTGHLVEFKEFSNHAEVGAEVCPDGRNDPSNTIAGPGEIKVDRRLAGLPATRKSTSYPIQQVLDDPDLYAYITTSLSEKMPMGHDEDEVRELIEFVGAHIISTHPSHGCGYLTGETLGVGHTPEIGMRLGGLKEYAARINGGFEAFNNAAKSVGARGATFNTIIDHYSQGLIIAPPDLISHMKRGISLRQNLTDLHDNETLVMSEQLDETYFDRINGLAQSMGTTSIDTRRYQNLASNAIILRKIAMEIALEEEKAGFPNIPHDLLASADASNTAARLLQYVLVRNSAMRTLSGLRKGNHPLMKHPEQFVRVGSSGAENNTQFVPFVLRTPSGPIQEHDVEGALKLYGLLYGTLVDQGAQLMEEGRVILVTGDFNEDEYKTEEIAAKKRTQAESNVANNAARFRSRLEDSIETGEVVVLGGIINSKTKEVDGIVSRVTKGVDPEIINLESAE